MHVIILCLLICLFSASGDRKLSYSKHGNKILKFRGGSAAIVGEDAVDALPSATVTKGSKRKNNSKGKKQIVNSKGTWLDYIRSFFHSSNRTGGEDGIAEKIFKFIKESFNIFGKKKKPTRKMMTKEHLEKSFTSGDANSRIQKEMRSFIANPPDNCELFVGSNIRSWVIGITGAEGTIYAGEKYKLKMIFPKDYPSKPPSVYFLKPAPKHMHVYSNGDICLNLLGKDWRPTMTAQTLAVSILSILSNAKEKRLPQDNALHADAAPGQQQDNWMYHDDRC